MITTPLCDKDDNNDSKYLYILLLLLLLLLLPQLLPLPHVLHSLRAPMSLLVPSAINLTKQTHFCPLLSDK